MSVAETLDPVRCAKGLRLLPDRAWAELARVDVLVYPGGDGTRIDVEGAERFIDTGEVITAAGVSAGIDVALHLVARLSSRENAATVRRLIQYDPAPAP